MSITAQLSLDSSDETVHQPQHKTGPLSASRARMKKEASLWTTLSVTFLLPFFRNKFHFLYPFTHTHHITPQTRTHTPQYTLKMHTPHTYHITLYTHTTSYYINTPYTHHITLHTHMYIHIHTQAHIPDFVVFSHICLTQLLQVK